MSVAPNSTIAQLVFPGATAPNLARLVAELDTELRHHHPAGHTLSWDCDDVAQFDVDGVRVLLGLGAAPGTANDVCLTVAVGPTPNHEGPASPLAERHKRVCVLIVAGIESRHRAERVAWLTNTKPLTADLVDELTDSLAPSPAVSIRPRHPQATQRQAQRERIISDQVRLSRVRDALYTVQDDKPAAPSPQLRLASHALNCALIPVALPVGAALMTYSLLRGENLNLSARAAAITGTAVGFWQAGLGDQIAQMI